jgi:transposase-like protein
MISDSKFVKLLERKKESGLSVKSFCSNEGIAPSTFYYWQKKIRKEAEAKRFIPLVIKTAETSVLPVKKTELSQNQRVDNALFEITYPNGITLRIKNDLDLARLRALIYLLD